MPMFPHRYPVLFRMTSLTLVCLTLVSCKSQWHATYAIDDFSVTMQYQFSQQGQTASFERRMQSKGMHTLDALTMGQDGHLIGYKRTLVMPKGTTTTARWSKDTLYAEDPALVLRGQAVNGTLEIPTYGKVWHAVGMDIYPLIHPQLLALKQGESQGILLVQTPSGDQAEAFYHCMSLTDDKQVFLVRYGAANGLLTFENQGKHWLITSAEWDNRGDPWVYHIAVDQA